MDLFSKIFGPRKEVRGIVFSRTELSREITRLADKFYDLRETEGHTTLFDFLEKSLNLDILLLADSKEMTGEAYAYRRGRIDSVKGVLLAVEQSIANSQKEKQTKATKSPSDSPMKRSYINRPKIVGVTGLSD